MQGVRSHLPLANRVSQVREPHCGLKNTTTVIRKKKKKKAEERGQRGYRNSVNSNRQGLQIEKKQRQLTDRGGGGASVYDPREERGWRPALEDELEKGLSPASDT